MQSRIAENGIESLLGFWKLIRYVEVLNIRYKGMFQPIQTRFIDLPNRVRMP